MKHLAIILLLLSSAMAQETITVDNFKLATTDSEYLDFNYVIYNMIDNRILSLFTKYQKECLDTLKATYYNELDNYFVDRGNYTEAFSKEQLETMDYKYKYRWITQFDPIEFEYIFIKEPTIQGFMEYLKEQLGLEKVTNTPTLQKITYTDSAYVGGVKKQVGKNEYYIYERDDRSDVEIYR